ncbi:MAG: EAL domain-containing protein [Alphaproteobacteria bacterium]|nr:EAL domain-containing protein [Alphaproteobacteria bacterium]
MPDIEALFDAMLSATSDAVMVTDQSGKIARVNGSFEKLTGFSSDQLAGEDARDLFKDFNDEEFCDALWAGDGDAVQQFDSVRSKHADGKAQLHGLSMTPILTDEGNPSQFLAVILSDSFQTDAESDSGTRRVGYDSLTGLPDRSLLSDRVDQAILNARRTEKSIALLVMGIDKFTFINDALGFSVGDAMLKEMSERLLEVIRQSDTAARLDGDKFAVVTPIAAIDDSVIVAEKVLHATEKIFKMGDEKVRITMSIGISIWPADGEDFDVLLKDSLSAMQHAKGLGGNQYQFFATDMNTKAKARLDLEKRMRVALEKEHYVLYYQPKVSPGTEKVKGCEALVRWEDPEKGLIGPDLFIPVAEETGMIQDIGNWVLRRACFQNKDWQDKGYDPVRRAVNVSPHQFRSPDIYDRIVSALNDSGLHPRWLELEITESMLMDNIDESIAKMQQMRDLGCGLAIDDFGTGYSSLSYLGRFPITTLKIDRAFVHDVQENENTAEIARAIIGLSKGLDLEIVAEGAEIVEHVDFLRDNGCDVIQGYFYSRPVTAHEMEDMLRQSSLMPA